MRSIHAIDSSGSLVRGGAGKKPVVGVAAKKRFQRTRFRLPETVVGLLMRIDAIAKNVAKNDLAIAKNDLAIAKKVRHRSFGM